MPEQIETGRLILRPPQAGDGAATHAAVCDSLAELRAWPANLPWAVPEPTIAASETFCRKGQAQFLLRTSLIFLIFERLTGQMVGVCSLHKIDWPTRRCEVGFWGRSGTHGRGYLSEALRALTALAIAPPISARRLELFTDARNHRARALAERVGFRFEGVMRDYCVEPDGTRRDLAVYGLVP
nr:GNAT family protein [Niveibacterium umoris]